MLNIRLSSPWPQILPGRRWHAFWQRWTELLTLERTYQKSLSELVTFGDRDLADIGLDHHNRAKPSPPRPFGML